MATTVDKFHDIGNVEELHHHKLQNVSAYLLSCGFKMDTGVNYRYLRIFVDKKNNRSIKVHLEHIDDRKDIVERIELIGNE
jgi:hypothetical protein